MHKGEINQSDSLSLEPELRNRRQHLFMGKAAESSLSTVVVKLPSKSSAS